MRYWLYALSAVIFLSTPLLGEAVYLFIPIYCAFVFFFREFFSMDFYYIFMANFVVGIVAYITSYLLEFDLFYRNSDLYNAWDVVVVFVIHFVLLHIVPIVEVGFLRKFAKDDNKRKKY